MGDFDGRAVNAYVTWAVNSVVGLTREADAVLRQFPAEVAQGAAWQREHQPQWSLGPLYRGFVLTEAQAVLAEHVPYAAESVSYSETRDVARWFACPDAVISGAIVGHEGRARVAGYLTKRTTVDRERVLFHHAWRTLWTPAGTISLVAAAAYAARIGALPPTGAHQLAWALSTQAEIILQQDAVLPCLTPLPCVGDCAALEQRFGYVPPQSH